jgi:hypothetical protein
MPREVAVINPGVAIASGGVSVCRSSVACPRRGPNVGTSIVDAANANVDEGRISIGLCRQACLVRWIRV